MIKTHSDDPDVADAAAQALEIINRVLNSLPQAQTYDYGGNILHLGDYGVCNACAMPIAEAQASHNALHEAAQKTADETVKEHVQIAADFFRLLAGEAILRAELHNGLGTEPLLDRLLGYQYNRGIRDDYQHHHGSNVDGEPLPVKAVSQPTSAAPAASATPRPSAAARHAKAHHGNSHPAAVAPGNQSINGVAL